MPICGGSAPNSWSVGARITRAASFRPSLPWSTGISSRSPRAGSSNGVPRPRVGRSLSRRGARSGFVLRRSLRETAGVRSALGAGGGSGGHEGRASQDRLAGHDGCATRCAQGLAVCRRGTTCADARLLSVNPRYRDIRHEGQFYLHNVHRNSVYKLTPSWWLARKFLDSMGPGLPIAASFYRVA